MAKTVFDACRKDERIEACQLIDQQIDKVRDGVKETIEELGIKDATAVAAAATGLITQQNIRVRGKSVPLLGNDTSFIQVGKEQIRIGLTWNLP
ncbi:MAG: hypothetical protein HC840_16905 [Leptolyngbyaceae cyanobacterium RM2_2_4]|nr:hypothetical protein [Leptolyngbyaceae cyanobacterium RM2_2_4]